MLLCNDDTVPPLLLWATRLWQSLTPLHKPDAPHESTRCGNSFPSASLGDKQRLLTPLPWCFDDFLQLSSVRSPWRFSSFVCSIFLRQLSGKMRCVLPACMIICGELIYCHVGKRPDRHRSFNNKQKDDSEHVMYLWSDKCWTRPRILRGALR